MLSPAHPLTDDAALRWARAGVPHWVPRGLLTAGWLVAVLSTLLSAGSVTPCGAADPEVCSAGSGFLVALLATPVLLLWLPPVGCLAGVLFALVELLHHDVPVARLAFGLHGLACLAVLVWLLVTVRRQRSVAVRTAGGLSAVVPSSVGEHRDWQRARLLAAAVSVLLAAGLSGWYWHLLDVERQHLDRAVAVDGRLVGNDHEARLTVRIPAGSRPERELGIDVGDATAYPDHGAIPLLVDPADPDWVRPAGEALDETIWAGTAAGAGGLALLLIWRELDRLAALRRLPGNRPAVRVRIVPDDGDALVLPATGSSVPVARLSVLEAWPDGIRPPGDSGRGGEEAEDALDRAWRGEPVPDPGFFGRGPAPVDAVLVGDLRDRGWALVQTADGLLLPLAPLAVRGWRPTGSAQLPALAQAGARPSAGIAPEPDDDLPGVPVPVTPLPAQLRLPLVAGPSRGNRRLGGLALAAGLIGTAVAIAMAARDGLAPTMAALGLLRLAEWGGDRALLRVELATGHFTLSRGTRVTEAAWPRLAGVRLDGERLLPRVRGSKDEPTRYGPFATGPGQTEEQAAAVLAATMMALRDRAGGTPRDAPGIRSRRRPLWWVFALYAVAAAASLLWSWFG